MVWCVCVLCDSYFSTCCHVFVRLYGCEIPVNLLDTNADRKCLFYSGFVVEMQRHVILVWICNSNSDSDEYSDVQ